MRGLRSAVLAASALALLAGCLDSHGAKAGTATDPSLPGIELSGNATWDGGKWVVTADAVNRGGTTYRVDTGCSSPFGLEARADKGEPYQEVQCLAYTPPIDFPPGRTAHRGWTVDPGPLGWSGKAHFTVSFEDAEDTGQVRLQL
jgi:hypothetical protein